MKKLLFIAAIAGLAFACNSDAKQSTADSSALAPPTRVDPSPDAAQSTLKDGLMTMKDSKMMIVKSGAWVAMDSAVTCTNGRKVAVDGTVSKGDKKRKLEEGMMIDKDGQLMDKDGNAMDTSGGLIKNTTQMIRGQDECPGLFICERSAMNARIHCMIAPAGVFYLLVIRRCITHPYSSSNAYFHPAITLCCRPS